ncbi:MAG: DciA family protein [Gammaproteobacteria bacterium]
MRNNSGFSPVSRSLNSSSELQKVFKYASYLFELDKKFQSKLPSTLKEVCHIANIRQDVVVLICKSRLEASKIRMYNRVILQIIQQDFKITAKKLKIILESEH